MEIYWDGELPMSILKLVLIIHELHGSWRNYIFTRACFICE